MFTGLIERMGTITETMPDGPGIRISIAAGSLAGESTIGDSVSINGCCLSVVGHSDETLIFEAGPETLSKTSIGRLVVGNAVNLERAMKWDDRLGGHVVTGHVDGVGRLTRMETLGSWSTCWLTAARELVAQMAPKGSVAIDGVSLTVVDVGDDAFSVALIPHTQMVTNLGQLEIGKEVNLETDLVFKYVARWLSTKTIPSSQRSSE
ncbi:MAG: riboflavin synthase [Pirellulales bacterium]|nr:riboflavin synthase [Pirellulales bacterium]